MHSVTELSYWLQRGDTINYVTISDWGNIGDLLGGISATLLAIAAIVGGSAGLGDWRARQQKEKELAEEKARSIRIERERVLHGWSPQGVSVYGVTLVTEPDELARAIEEQTTGQPSDYVVLRVNETTTGNANRAFALRQLITSQGYISQAPSAGEYEALKVGRNSLNKGTKRHVE
jgi:hypothetical protein